MTELKENEITEIVKALENDADHTAMRTLAKSRHELYSMKDIPILPEHMTRGDVVDFPSPMLRWLTSAILADILAYPTSVTVVPFGSFQEQADKLEKWGTLFRNRLNEGRRVDRQIRWHQLVTGYGVMILHCGEDEEFPWSMETPDPLTCFFPLSDAPERPSMMARRYKLLVRQAEKRYTGRRGPYADGRLKYNGSTWDFHPLSDDRATDSGSSNYSAGPFEECEMVWLAYDGMIYHVALNKGSQNQGRVVWSGPNLTGEDAPAIIVPGNVTPLREMAERFEPGMLPVMQMVKGINRARAMRLTRSEQMKPDVLLDPSPEQIAAMHANPEAAQVRLQMEAGSPNMINAVGKPTLWVTEPDPDLDKYEQSLWDEVNRYINSALEVTDPEVLQHATANGILTAVETRRRQQAPMLAHLDWAWAETIRMAVHSIGKYGSEYELYSEGGERYGDGKAMEKGKSVALKSSELWKFDRMDMVKAFPYNITVSTQSSTEAEQRARVQDWEYRKALGLSTTKEGITVAGYTDEAAQLKALAVDRGVEMVTPMIEAEVAAVLAERIRMRSRLIVQLGAPTQMPQPTGGTVGGNPMRAAAISGPAGGSDAAAVA